MVRKLIIEETAPGRFTIEMVTKHGTGKHVEANGNDCAAMLFNFLAGSHMPETEKEQIWVS